MSVRLLLVILLSFNVSCTSVFNSNELDSMTSVLSKYNDFAYYVDMDDPISITTQNKFSKGSIEFEFFCFYDKSIDQEVSNLNSCNDLNNLF